MINKIILMPCAVLSGLQEPDLVVAVRRLNPHLTTELKYYTYLRQGRNYDGQINVRQDYCPVRGGDKITRTKTQLYID